MQRTMPASRGTEAIARRFCKELDWQDWIALPADAKGRSLSWPHRYGYDLRMGKECR